MTNDFIIGKHFIATVLNDSLEEEELDITFQKVQVLDKIFNERTIEPQNEESPIITYRDTTFMVQICSTGEIAFLMPFCLEVYVEGWSDIKVKKTIKQKYLELDEELTSEINPDLPIISDIQKRLDKIMSLGYSEEEAMKLIDQQNEEIKKKK